MEKNSGKLIKKCHFNLVNLTRIFILDVVARQNDSNQQSTGCTFCGCPGHSFRYQCRCFQHVNRQVAIDINSSSSDSEVDMVTIALPGALQITSG